MKCDLKEFTCYKALASAIIFIIGLILKFPGILESNPVKYDILGILITEAQYAVVEYISYLLILLPIVYLTYLIGRKEKVFKNNK